MNKVATGVGNVKIKVEVKTKSTTLITTIN